MVWHSSMTSANDSGSPDIEKLPGFDQREIENFVDQLQQIPSRLENLAYAFLLGRRRRRESDSINCAKPRIALSGVRSLAHAGEEIRFCQVGFFPLWTWRSPTRHFFLQNLIPGVCAR